MRTIKIFDISQKSSSPSSIGFHHYKPLRVSAGRECQEFARSSPCTQPGTGPQWQGRASHAKARQVLGTVGNLVGNLVGKSEGRWATWVRCHQKNVSTFAEKSPPQTFNHCCASLELSSVLPKNNVNIRLDFTRFVNFIFLKNHWKQKE